MCRSRPRRLVGKCARYTAGGDAGPTVGVTGLLATDGGVLRRGVRLITFCSLFRLRKIQVRRHLRAHVVVAHNRRDNGLNALHKARLDLIEIFELRRVESGFVAAHIGRDQ